MFEHRCLPRCCGEFSPLLPVAVDVDTEALNGRCGECLFVRALSPGEQAASDLRNFGGNGGMF